MAPVVDAVMVEDKERPKNPSEVGSTIDHQLSYPLSATTYKIACLSVQ